jgi:hypothetical protein
MDQSQIELEKPMKVYQGKALHDEIVAVKKLLENQNSMLQNTVTLQYMEERFKNQDEKHGTEIATLRQRYDPVLKNANWAAKTGILAALTLITTLITIIIKSS